MLVIVIPAYDEAATIAGIVRACRTLQCVWETIVVDDGSRDETASIAAEHGARVLRHPRNVGKGAALLRGMRTALASGARYIVTLDGDGQHRPEEVPRMLAAALAFPSHIVIGSRRKGRKNAPRGRAVANRIADFWISWAARQPIEDSQSGFRLYPANLLDEMLARPITARGFAFESEVLIDAGRIGYRTVAVDIPAIYGERLKRRSYFRPVSDISKIVLMVAGKLLRRGMDPVGLWRSLIEVGERYPPAQGSTIVARPRIRDRPLAERKVKL
jgi:glycosyltransferase involved in cell wall biosynthesis